MKAVLLCIFSIVAFTLQAQQVSPAVPMAMVQGEGVIKVAPDAVLIRSRIEHEGQDPQEVKEQNDSVVNNIIKYLKQQGIPAENVQTEYINLNKNYNYDNKTYSYVANQAISIKLEDLEDYEEIMTGLLDVGLNRIDGVEFKTSELEKHQTEARKKAVINARQKAQEYATALGQKIGKAVIITEIEGNNYPPMYRVKEMSASADGATEETIAPGEIEIKAKISVGFELLK